MAVTPTAIIASKYAEGAQTTNYTSTGVKTIIDKFTLTNVFTGVYTVSVNLVPSGVAVSAANLILDTKTLQPNETYTCPELVGHVLEAGDFISLVASVNNVVTVRASGRVVT